MKTNTLKKDLLEDIEIKKMPHRITFLGKKLKLFTRSKNVALYEAVRTVDKPFFLIGILAKHKIKNKEGEPGYVEFLIKIDDGGQWTFTDYDEACERFNYLFNKHG